MKILLVFALSLLSWKFEVISASSDISWTIYHSWNPQQNFVKRGAIVWNKDNNVEEGDSAKSDASSILEITNDSSLTTQDINNMLKYGWYHVKLVPNSNPDDVVLGTVPACNVRRANFKDVFDITLPRSHPSEDHILSFAYTPLVSPLAPKSCDEYPPLEDDATKSFQSKTSVKLDTPGLPLKPVLSTAKPPPGLTFMKRPRDAKTGGKKNNKENDDYEDPTEANKPEPPTGMFGFLQRYWYLILPMVVMQFLAPPPEDSQQQQGQNAQQQGQDAQPAAAATAATASPTKKSGRRGKRN